MRFLEISGSDLSGWNMRRDREHRSVAAMRIEKSVDKVKVAGDAAARAGREFPAELGLGAGCERAGFLVTHMDPFKLPILANRIGHRIQAVADDTVNP